MGSAQDSADSRVRFAKLHASKAQPNVPFIARV